MFGKTDMQSEKELIDLHAHYEALKIAKIKCKKAEDKDATICCCTTAQKELDAAQKTYDEAKMKS